MKKLFLLAVAVAALYYFKPELFYGMPGFGHSAEPDNVELFVFAECGPPCDKAQQILKDRNIEFTLYDVNADQAAMDHLNKRGNSNHYPIMFVGNERVDGFYPTRFTHALARVFGIKALDYNQRDVVQHQIDKYGENTAVMYGTAWCPYCKKAREYFSDKGINFVEIDPEKSPEVKRHYTRLEGTGYPLIYIGANRFEGFDRRVKKGIQEAL